jgi:hypothetical protein
LGAYAFLWGIYQFSGYNWFLLNTKLQDTRNQKELNSKEKIKDTKDCIESKELNVGAMTKQQLVDHAKTLGLSLDIKLKKQEIINQINNH